MCDGDGVCTIFVNCADEDVSGFRSLESVSCMGTFSGTIFDKGGESGMIGCFEVIWNGYFVLHNWDGMSDLVFCEESWCEVDECGNVWVVGGEEDALRGRDILEEWDIIVDIEYWWDWEMWIIGVKEVVDLVEGE